MTAVSVAASSFARRRLAPHVAIALAAVLVLASAPPVAADESSDGFPARPTGDEAAVVEPAAPDDGAFTLASTAQVDPWDGSAGGLADLVRSLLGEDGTDVSVRDIRFTGDRRAIGAYRDLPTGSSATSSGVVLSSGDVRDAAGSAASTDLDEPGDARLDALVGGVTYDAAVLEFEFRTPRTRITFDYQFASEEFPNFVGSAFNDVFAFDIDGRNCALTPQGELITVNTTPFTPAPELGYGGISQRLSCSTTVAPNTWSTARLAIADTSDGILDSAVLLGSQSVRFSSAGGIQPLMFAHGFRLFGVGGGAPSWDPALALLFDSTVLQQDDPRVVAVSSTSTSASINDNADALVDEAQRLYDAAGGTRVNVIAHSKGGLDTRLAALRRPDLFGTIVMLGTPNAGSQQADTICLPGQSNCSDATDDLRVGPMLTFNRIYPASASQNYWLLGGDNRTVGNRCGTESRNVVREAERKGYDWWAYGTIDTVRGDNNVCINSLLALSTVERFASLESGRERGPADYYRHQEIGVYDDIGHGDLRSDACALLPAFARVLPPGAFNPEVETRIGRIDGCPVFTARRIASPDANLASMDDITLTAASTDAPVVLELAADDPDTVEVVASTRRLDLTEATTATMIELPEFPDVVTSVEVIHDADTIVLRDADDDELTAEIGELFDAEVARFHSPLPAGPYQLELTGGTTAVVVVNVAERSDEPELDLQLDGTELTVSVAGADGVSIAGELYVEQAGAVLVDAVELTGTGVATHVVTVEPGLQVEVYVELEEPYLRALRAELDVPDDRVTVGQLVDQDDDGTRLRATFPVTVVDEDSYIVTLELVAPDGSLVSAAVASADLLAGTTDVALDLDRAAVRRAVEEGVGPLTFRSAVVAGAAPLRVISELDGPFGELDVSGLASDETPLLGTVEVTFDGQELRYEVPVLGTAGQGEQLLVEGDVLGPEFEPVTSFAEFPDDGSAVLRLSLAELQATGSGQYLLVATRLVDAGTGQVLDSGQAESILIEVAEQDGPVAPTPSPRPEQPDPDTSEEVESLPDIVGTTHEEAIRLLEAEGIIAGYPDGLFRPNEPVERGQVASMLQAALELSQPDPDTPLPFTDVVGTTHESGVRAVHAAGIVSGYPDGTYRPGQPVDRGQMASMLQVAFDLDVGDPAATPPFLDILGTTHEEGIRAVAIAEISRGYPDGTYRPTEPVTRGQLATLLVGALGIG